MPVSVPKWLCYRFLTPAAALFEVRSGAEEPGEGHVRTALSCAAAKARDRSKYLAWQHEGRGAHRTGSCSEWLLGGFMCPADFCGKGDPQGVGARVMVS